MSFIAKIKYSDIRNIKNNNIVLKLFFIIMILNLITPAIAEQRTIINSGFEDVSLIPGGVSTFRITSDANIPGWNSTSGNIEVWRDGFLAKSASAGTYFIELNPNVPIGLYQEVCLVNGESLSWTFDHAARTGGASPQTVNYEVADLSGNLVQTLDTSSVSPNANNALNDWSTVSNSVTYTGPTGIQRLQFRSTNAGSVGNFLDDIQITLVPQLAFNPINTSSAENSTVGLPAVFVTGEVPSVITVNLSIDPASTATIGSDYNLVSSSITIPAGTYDGVSASSEFFIPITVFEDTELGEPDETILINLDSGTAANPLFNPIILGGACEDSGTPQIQHTIIDPVTDLKITKTVNDATPNIGDTVTFSLLVENLGPNTATDILVTDVVPAGFTYVTNSMTGIPSPVTGITANQSSPDSASGLTWTIDSLTVLPTAVSSITLTFQAVVNAP